MFELLLSKYPQQLPVRFLDHQENTFQKVNINAPELSYVCCCCCCSFVYLYISSMKSNEFTFTIPSIPAVITKAEFSGWSIIFVIAWFEEQEI